MSKRDEMIAKYAADLKDKTKVTPDIEAPIIPKDTTYHGDLFSPLKKAALLPPFLPVIWAIISRIPK